MPLSGRCLVEQHGREALLAPFDLALHDPGRPHAVVPEAPCRFLTLTFPQHSLRLPADHVARLTATRITGGQGVPALLCALLRELPSATAALTATQAVRLTDSILGLVNSTLADRIGAEPAEAGPGQRALLLRMQAFAEEHLADADLSPTDIAAAVHVSIGYLHRVFRAEGTTASRWIRARRLEHCRRELAGAGGTGVAVGMVAARWGFVDAAHFSKLFKSAYGVPPREYRILHEPDQAPGNDGTSRPVME